MSDWDLQLRSLHLGIRLRVVTIVTMDTEATCWTLFNVGSLQVVADLLYIARNTGIVSPQFCFSIAIFLAPTQTQNSFTGSSLHARHHRETRCNTRLGNVEPQFVDKETGLGIKGPPPDYVVIVKASRQALNDAR